MTAAVSMAADSAMASEIVQTAQMKSTAKTVSLLNWKNIFSEYSTWESNKYPWNLRKILIVLLTGQ